MKTEQHLILSLFPLLFVLCLLMLAPTPAQAEVSLATEASQNTIFSMHVVPLTTTVVLTPSKDNTLYESATGTLSNGAGQFLFAGNTSQPADARRRGLLAFELTGTIPAGATILSAMLQLHVSNTPGGDQVVALHTVTQDWGEGTSIGARGEGGGAAAATGDATWLYSVFTTTTWTNAGGDFATAAIVTTTVGSAGQFVQWGSTAAMVDDIQGWLDKPATNFGWLLMGNENEARSVKRFDSKDNTTAENRPSLTIRYVMSAPTFSLYMPFLQKE